MLSKYQVIHWLLSPLGKGEGLCASHKWRQCPINHSDDRHTLLLPRHHNAPLVENSQPQTWTCDRREVSQNLLFKMLPMFWVVIMRPNTVL